MLESQLCWAHRIRPGTWEAAAAVTEPLQQVGSSLSILVGHFQSDLSAKHVGLTQVRHLTTGDVVVSQRHKTWIIRDQPKHSHSVGRGTLPVVALTRVTAIRLQRAV